MGILEQKAEKVHEKLRYRLMASGDDEIYNVGSELSDLHALRCKADYDMAPGHGSESPPTAEAAFKQASDLIAILDSCPINSDRWKKIQAAIKSVNI